MNNSVIVSLRDIVVEFDGQRILDGLNLDIHDKEFVTLLGSSGCGKTTTLRLIAGFLEPTSGKVLLKGEDITGVPPYKRPVNTVFQSFQLMPREGAVENVALPLSYAGVRKKERRSRATKALERVGLGDRVNFRPTQLSGGQKQRVAIARAMVNHPKILLADEPTGALDSKSGEQIMELFDSLNEEGVTIVMITHDPKIAAKAKRIVRIIDGEIYEGEEDGAVS